MATDSFMIFQGQKVLCTDSGSLILGCDNRECGRDTFRLAECLRGPSDDPLKYENCVFCGNKLQVIPIEDLEKWKKFWGELDEISIG